MEGLILFFPPPPVFMTRFWNNEAAGRCSIATRRPVLPARGLHIPAEGPGWDFITGLGRLGRQMPAQDQPSRRRPARSQPGFSAALDGAEDALNVHGEPTGSALRLLEAAEAFNVSQPANWCLKGKISQEYPGQNVEVWSFRNGKLVQKV
ncbi:hypothetical protein Bbelb_327990 [Branchiostoma belcheri]|nr:hypothetical protein Bbelb_327990 [Branchiostoma belcheri]